MYLMKNFPKGGMGEGLKFVTLDGGFTKIKRKKIFAFFVKMTQFSDVFWLSFALNDLF